MYNKRRGGLHAQRLFTHFKYGIGWQLNPRNPWSWVVIAVFGILGMILGILIVNWLKH